MKMPGIEFVLIVNFIRTKLMRVIDKLKNKANQGSQCHMGSHSSEERLDKQLSDSQEKSNIRINSRQEVLND
jgi:hypothetical protein